MSITLKIPHSEGLRLRQQAAHTVERNVDNVITNGTEWKFEKDDLGRDEDPRLRDGSGKPVKLDSYTVYITARLKNLVVERKGKIASVEFRNSALRNQLRLQYQAFVDVRKDQKSGKPQLEWRNSGPAQYALPNTFTGVFVGDGQRVIVDEMPT